MPRHALVTLDQSPLSETILSILPSVLDRGDAITLFSVAVPVDPTRRRRAGPIQPIVMASSMIGGLEPAPPVYAESKDQVIQREEDELTDYLTEKALALRDQGFQVDVHAIIDDHPTEAIVDFARRLQPTFIAMATHGRSGLNELIHGSVAEAVVRSGVAPVLMLRPAASPAEQS